MQIRHFFAAILLVLTALSAMAVDRLFPPTAKRGTFSFENYPVVTIDNTERTLSAGLRIWNTGNLTQVSGSLAGTRFVANYTENMMGHVDRIWILTNQELLTNAPSASSSTSTSTSTSTTTSTSTSTTTGTQ